MSVKIKGLFDEDFVNYFKPCMALMFPNCSWKCEKECGKRVCQNSTLANSLTYETTAEAIVDRYLSNPITQAIVMGGLEPMDSFNDVIDIISTLRERNCNDDVVIYTGYYKPEIAQQVKLLSKFKNIVIKFGRFVPDRTSHYDSVLGVMLANDEQYAERIC